jgi:hypothetical protein
MLARPLHPQVFQLRIRARTRATFVSIAGTGASNAKAMMAAAV